MYECNASSSICHCCISFGGVELFGAFHFDTACFDDAYDVAHVESRMNKMSVMPLYRLVLVRFPFLPFIVGVVGCLGWLCGLEFTGRPSPSPLYNKDVLWGDLYVNKGGCCLKTLYLRRY